MPVLVLTARGAWTERVEGIDAGADDYLPRPFHMEELVARASGLVRRAAGHATSTLTIGELSIDANRMTGALRGVPLSALRRHVALVRGVELFPGTVLDNVRLGRDLSLEDVSRALRQVGLLDELLELPDGLATVLHPHGRPLSYRQACRLMIARAIAGRPRLIVLDGALDQIDPRDEQELADVLFAPDARWTLICITERPDLLHRCTRQVRLEAGEVRDLRPGESRS